MRSVIQRKAGLHHEEAAEREKNEDREVRPGPRDAQVFRQGRARTVRGRKNTRGVHDWVASKWRCGLFGRSRLRGACWSGAVILCIGRMVVEKCHRFFPRALSRAAFLGQPHANAAATSGIITSW